MGAQRRWHPRRLHTWLTPGANPSYLLNLFPQHPGESGAFSEAEAGEAVHDYLRTSWQAGAEISTHSRSAKVLQR